ncbi:MAG TPA: hypothetical protein DCP69_02330 [Candidatus Omnitrophica bacterium]|nr:hypothetical protein [Candidatus Omnitrophota bacterium]
METTLFGADRERNGGGFIKETVETLEVIRAAVMRTPPAKVVAPRRHDARDIMVAFIKSVAGPAIVAAIMLLR